MNRHTSTRSMFCPLYCKNCKMRNNKIWCANCTFALLKTSKYIILLLICYTIALSFIHHPATAMALNFPSSSGVVRRGYFSIQWDFCFFCVKAAFIRSVFEV